MALKTRLQSFIKSWRLDIKKNRYAYLFLLPFTVIFAVFYLLPVLISIFYSFTYYNILESPVFVGWKNYVKLFTNDEIFLNSLQNTFVLAIITGPAGYLASLLLAWAINELKPIFRAILVTLFYAPVISGSVYMIWAVIFSGDAYGYMNSFLMSLGITSEPILWLTDPKYMMIVVIIVVLWMSLGAGFLAFVAGLQGIDAALYEAGMIDGIRNRWQELWFITLPVMKPQLMFGAVISITATFAISDVTVQLCGLPSTDYAVHTVVNHLQDYGGIRFDMGYASSIATVLFIIMIGINKIVQRLIRKVGS